jgi:hypothetical protein
MADISNTIYVVGFPKSGNTWLTRLVADALAMPVQDRVMRNSPEIAADVNSQLGNLNWDRGRVAKVHFMPGHFRREIAGSPGRVIYVHRDIRDVLISAYFYFNGDAATVPPPLSTWQRLLGRTAGGALWSKQFWAFADEFLRHGIRTQQEEFGTWSSHIESWRHFLAAAPQTLSTCVSYEQLSLEPAKTLSRVFAKLKIEPPPESALADAIKRQSFDALRKQASERGDSLQFGKEFNTRFLRRGVVGDWRSFYSYRCVARFPSEVRLLMKRLDYI